MNTGIPFVLFGPAHLAALAVIALMCVLVPLGVRRFAGASERTLAITLGVLLIVYEFAKSAARVVVYDQPLAANLPLHLCSAEVLLVGWMLLRRSYAAFEVAYFWGMAGTLQALLMPDIQDGFPTFAFLTFFIGHGAALLGVALALIVYRFRPTWRSLRRTFIVTIFFAVPVSIVNVVLDTNYLYLMQKPAAASILDTFGPWPFYIPWLVLLAVVSCVVVYLPFAIADMLGRRSGQPPDAGR